MSSSWRRGVGPNTVLATVSDLRAFFVVIDKEPAAVTAADVFEFITVQRRGDGDGRVVRLADGEAASGMPVKVDSQRVGHADVGVTLKVNAHVLPGDDEDAALRADSLLSP
jgi:hypothetical protein